MSDSPMSLPSIDARPHGATSHAPSGRGRLVGFGRATALTIALSAFVFFVAQPISVEAQSFLAIVAISVMAALWMFAAGALARFGFLATGSLIVLRYVYWRASSTLPSIDQPVSFVFGIILFAAELYCVGFFVLNLVINADPMARKPAKIEPDDMLPTVDVFVPSYNESEAILAVTLAAARSMDYPASKLTVWLLDDGGTDQKCGDDNAEKAASARQRRASLQQLCGQLGARYLTRARNEHAKAGNLNAGLLESSGDIVVVFDADHVPFRQFLRETIGYFAEDPRLFLVQTPHVFLNPDPIEKNLRTFDRMPSENEMFYSMTQRGLDKWNGSFFCGSAALLRREALKEAGGFSGVTITEDCETAFELHSKGWSSLYVDKPLIAGLQPETFESFIGQRSRWCQGMFQIMLLKNPALKRGLAPIQRLAYLSSMMYWLFPLPRLIFMFAPLLHIFFDVKIFTSSIDETIAYTASYMVVNVMIQSYLFGRVRWPWVSELYEYAQGVFLLGAIVSVVMSPRKPTFNVTAKGLSLDNDHLSALTRPFVVCFLVIASGVAMAGYRYAFEPGVTNLMLVVGMWSATNLVLAGAALGVVAERKQLDLNPRLPIARKGILSIGGRVVEVAIDSVSASGCSARIIGKEILGSQAADAQGQLVVTTLDSRPSPAPLMVKLADDSAARQTGHVALTFARLEGEQYFGLAELMYADGGAISRFLASRRKRRSFIGLTLQFLFWGAEGPIRAFRYWRAAAVDIAVLAPDAQEAVPLAAPAPEPVIAPQAAPIALQPDVVTPVVVAPREIRNAGLLADDTMSGAWMKSMLGLAAAHIQATPAQSAPVQLAALKERDVVASLRVA